MRVSKVPTRRTQRSGPKNHWRSVILTLAILTCLSFFASIIKSSAASSSARIQDKTPDKISERYKYKIDLKIDFDALSYTGFEHVRWINLGDKSASVLYFHLYSNLRTNEQATPNVALNNATAEVDEPRMEVLEVRTSSTNSQLPFSLDDQGTTLRVNLHESVAPQGIAEIKIKFKGTVPEIDKPAGCTGHVQRQKHQKSNGHKGLALRQRFHWD